MISYSIEKLARIHPEKLSADMHEFLQSGTHKIDDSADFQATTVLGKVLGIGYCTRLNGYSKISDGVLLGKYVDVGSYTFLAKNVLIGSFSTLGSHNYFASGSVLPQRSLDRDHVYMRKTWDNVTVGRNVVLPQEVQLGEGAIIPATETVGQIGRFGDKKRMVTAYGSDAGPLYSVGCQFGISMSVFKDRIFNNTQTESSSALDYAKNIEQIESLGIAKQRAYDDRQRLVDELLAERRETLVRDTNY